MADISGNGREDANSIVASGGYIDDEDFGDELIYTGAGVMGSSHAAIPSCSGN